MARPLLRSARPAVTIRPSPPTVPPSPDVRFNRATASVLTILLYALVALLAWLGSHASPPAANKPEIIASLLPDRPTKHVTEPLPPFLAHIVKPHAEQPAPPVFTIASGAPAQATAPLPASAAKSSPMSGGTAGDGTMGQAASGSGANGNGAGLAGCLDPEWMRAVTERVGQFFYYPDAALALGKTGVVMVRFVVRRDGRTTKLEVGKSSGDRGLDKAAYDIFQKAQPLPPIPDRMHTDQVDGELPINFGVRNFNGGGTARHC